jgi:hypothetical protein
VGGQRRAPARTPRRRSPRALRPLCPPLQACSGRREQQPQDRELGFESSARRRRRGGIQGLGFTGSSHVGPRDQCHEEEPGEVAGLQPKGQRPLGCWSWASTNTLSVGLPNPTEGRDEPSTPMNASDSPPTRPHLYIKHPPSALGFLPAATTRSPLPPSLSPFLHSRRRPGTPKATASPRWYRSLIRSTCSFRFCFLLFDLMIVPHAFLEIGAGVAKRHRLAQPAGRA